MTSLSSSLNMGALSLTSITLIVTCKMGLAVISCLEKAANFRERWGSVGGSMGFYDSTGIALKVGSSRLEGSADTILGNWGR